MTKMGSADDTLREMEMDAYTQNAQFTTETDYLRWLRGSWQRNMETDSMGRELLVYRRDATNHKRANWLKEWMGTPWLDESQADTSASDDSKSPNPNLP